MDIDPRTYNLDPALLDAAITPRTKAMVAVSLYGQCAEMDAINAIAAEHGIAVIEDGAQSFGATYKGRQSCNLSTIGCTSFFPSKPLGCYGDGGACFSNDEVLATRMRQIRVHGQDRRYHHPLVGINGRIDTLQAAVLLAKLEAFDTEVQLRSQLGAAYSEQLKDVVTTPYIEPYNTSVFAQYTIQVDNRQALQDRLKRRQNSYRGSLSGSIALAASLCKAGPGTWQLSAGGICCRPCGESPHAPIPERTRSTTGSDRGPRSNRTGENRFSPAGVVRRSSSK